MTSSGNDIVAIKAINITRTLQQKFYSKILSGTEIPLYNEFNLAGFPFEIFVWLLWSAKESAYKFLQRHNPALVFTPVRFICSNVVLSDNFNISPLNDSVIESQGFSAIPVISGSLKHDGNNLYFKSIINNHFIMTVVNDEDNFDNICWGIQNIGDNSQHLQSTQVRLFVLKRLKALSGKDYSIQKNEAGCPFLFHSDAPTDIPVSLSHHEVFVGYSMKL